MYILRFLLRLAIGLVGLVCCYWLIQAAARSGVSRLFTTTAIIQARIEAADEAVRLAPSDPEAHYTRALELVNLDRLSEAVAELRQATRLRPHHYYEWLDLGVTLDRLGDQTEAEAALRESVRLAPAFAQPRWQLGSFLFRQGQYEEAFSELRLGAKTNLTLVQELQELAWVAADGDIGTVEGLVQPTTRRSHLELAVFLAKRRMGSDAVRQVKEAGVPQDEAESTLLSQTMSALLGTHLFPEAHAVWATTHRSAIEAGEKDAAQFLNGDFAEPIPQNDPGFGWQVQATPMIAVSIDPTGPASGTRSIRVEYRGDSPPPAQPIYQLILVQPKTHYILSFVTKAENLVSGGPPVIAVVDPGGSPVKVLGQSKPLSPGTTGWTAYQTDFTTDEGSAAVTVGLQRLGCTQGPCPAFGKLWLSRFSLVRN